VPGITQYDGTVEGECGNIPHISRCFLTSLSSTVTYAFLRAVSYSSFTNSGMVIDNLPEF
jgi:hypothetical protein